MTAHVNPVEEEAGDLRSLVGVLKTSILSLTDDTIRFTVKGVDTAFINTLRRTMASEVPTMTIEDIFYFDNSSLVSDEILAHRLGLTPLKTDLDTYILPEDCDCESDLGCPKCRAVLTMDVEAEGETITVYSGDLTPDDPETTPAKEGIPLVKLAPGQAVRFEAYAQLGQGKTHVKWSPVSMCVYQNVSLVPVEDQTSVEECILNCGDAAIMEDGKLKVIGIQKFLACTLCRELVPRDVIMDNLVLDEFLFTVESSGALPPERIVIEAVKLLKGRLSSLATKVDEGELHDLFSYYDLPGEDRTRMSSLDLINIEPEEDETEEDEDEESTTN